MRTRTKIVTEQKLLSFLNSNIEGLERETSKNMNNIYLIGKLVGYKEVYKFITGIEE